ncbi:hypothetical protein OIU84_029268 [Salix udensis]|uniref:Uncharacterized protein n=1 Tax=Salix udensis TaxID=889485 RepID=A0AAD6P7R9_9ROSI|nr:hypothetical protein OIU84_029268 [Salix udensis]
MRTKQGFLSSTGTWKKRLAIGVTTGSFLFGILVIAVYQIYSFRKSKEEYQAKVERKHLHQELAAISEIE